jgi:transcriptional regulator with XRE-family HTH domain
LKKGLSQEEFADRAQIDRTYASGIERARRNPSLKAIARIADALGVSLAQLFREVERHL